MKNGLSCWLLNYFKICAMVIGSSKRAKGWPQMCRRVSVPLWLIIAEAMMVTLSGAMATGVSLIHAVFFGWGWLETTGAIMGVVAIAIGWVLAHCVELFGGGR